MLHFHIKSKRKDYCNFFEFCKIVHCGFWRGWLKWWYHPSEMRSFWRLLVKPTNDTRSEGASVHEILPKKVAKILKLIVSKWLIFKSIQKPTSFFKRPQYDFLPFFWQSVASSDRASFVFQNKGFLGMKNRGPKPASGKRWMISRTC